MTSLRVLLAHLAVAIREHRRRLTDEGETVPPELAAVSLDGPDRVRQLAAWLAWLVSRVLLTPELLSGPATHRPQPPPDADTPTGCDPDAMVLNIRSAARLLDVSPRTVERLVAAGDLETVKIAGARRIPREDLERYIARLRRAQASSPAVPPSAAGATGGTP